MPLKIYVSGKEMKINPTARFNTIRLTTADAAIETDPGYYAASLNITGR